MRLPKKGISKGILEQQRDSSNQLWYFRLIKIHYGPAAQMGGRERERLDGRELAGGGRGSSWRSSALEFRSSSAQEISGKEVGVLQLIAPLKKQSARRSTPVFLQWSDWCFTGQDGGVRPHRRAGEWMDDMVRGYYISIRHAEMWHIRQQMRLY